MEEKPIDHEVKSETISRNKTRFNLFKTSNDSLLKIYNLYVIVSFFLIIIGGFIWAIIDASTIDNYCPGIDCTKYYGIFKWRSSFAVWIFWIATIYMFAIIRLMISKLIISGLDDIKQIRKNINS